MDIPVTFPYNGKSFTGHLTPVNGSGGNMYHLMVGGFYKGQLVKTEAYGWQFHSQTGNGKELSEYFGRVVEESL